MWDLTIYLVNTPSLLESHTAVCLHFSRPLETQIPFGQDQLTEVANSVDGSIFQALRGIVLSMCCSIDTTHKHTCDRQLLCGHCTTETLKLTV